MSKQTLNTLKNWFRTGLKPTQQQFLDAWDSFWHKDDRIPAANIENLDSRFEQKADLDALNSHIADMDAHGLPAIPNLRIKNAFTAENSFEKSLRTTTIKTGTGIDFNLGLNDQPPTNQFASRLLFDNNNSKLSLTAFSPKTEINNPQFYNGTQLVINYNGDLELQGSSNQTMLKLAHENGFYQSIKPGNNITVDQELNLPDQHGTLARKEDLPVITAGNNVTLTGTYPQVTINATNDGPGNLLINLTYEEIWDTMNNAQLQPGQQYLITDFQSTMVYANLAMERDSLAFREVLRVTSTPYSGPVEPIIVTALTNNLLDPFAKSTIYPQDELIYTLQNRNGGILASTKGTIMKRTDHMLNNTANFDYRITQYMTDGANPQRALNLISNCTINASGYYGEIRPVIIGAMKNSSLVSSNGDYMTLLYDSDLDMEYGRINFNAVEVRSCNIKGPLLGIYWNNTDTPIYLNGIYAHVINPNSSINELKIANRETASYILQGTQEYNAYELTYNAAGVKAIKL